MKKFYTLTLLILGFSTYTFSQNIGIGTAVPLSKLSIKGGLAIGSNYAESNAAPADGLIIEGNVGIGEPSPSATLDVNGNFRVQIGTAINEFSTDGNLSGNSNNAIPTEQAVKTYVDGKTGGNETDPVWNSDKSDYYTIGNLQTSGQSSVHWNNLTNVPAGLNDGDDNTTYSAGNDLTLSGTTFSLEDDIDVSDIRSSGSKIEVHDFIDMNDNDLEEAYSVKFSNIEFNNTYFNEDANDYGRLAWDRSEGFKYYNDYIAPDHWTTIWDSDYDGAGSGMDADLLDGEQGTYYLDWNNLTNIPASISNGDNQDLADVLGQGNSAGTNGIDMNNQNITNVDYHEIDGYLEIVGSEKVIEFDGGESFITVHDGYGNFNILCGLDDDNNIVGSSSGGARLEMGESGTYDFETYDASAVKKGHLYLDQTKAYFEDVDLGIDQSSPSAKLDVVGATELNGDLTVIGTSDFTGNVNVNGDIILDGSDDDIHIYDANGTVHYFGDNDEADGIVLRTSGNPAAGEPIFVVESSGKAQRLRVEHDGAVYMSNVLEVAGTGDSYVAGRLAVGATSVSGSYDLYVNGRIGTNGINETSDKRYKKNITTVDAALDKVNQMRGVYYDWKQEDFPEKDFECGRQLGVIAQEVEEIIPEIVATDEYGYKAVEYGHITPVLIEAVKELSAKVNAQEQELTALRAQQKDMESLKAENTALRNDVDAIKEMLLMQACK